MSSTASASTIRNVRILAALAEAIRALGSVPSGHLYARVMGHVSLDEFQNALDVMQSLKLISVAPSHEVTWTGPALDRAADRAEVARTEE